MNIPPSDHFSPLDLAGCANAQRDALPEGFQVPENISSGGPDSCFRGIPFNLGEPGQPNAILLNKDPVELPLDGRKASYLVFLHIVEDRTTNYADGLADTAVDGNEPTCIDGCR